MDVNSKQRNDLFIELFSANYSRILSFIFTLVPNASDADDIMQETAKILWEKFDEFEIGTRFDSWAVTIAKFQVLSYRQKFNSKVPLNQHLIETLADESQVPLEKEHERLDALRGCLQKLSMKDKQLIHFRFEKRLTAKVLSKQLGVSMNTVYRNESRIVGLLLGCVRKVLGVEGA